MWHSRLIVTVAVLASICASPALAQVYKWVDAQGVTHYDSAPPPGSSSKVQTLAISTAPSADSSASSSWQDKDNEFRARYDKRKSDEAKEDAKKKKELAARQTACLKARTRMATYQQYGRIYHVDQDGNRVFLSDAERDQQYANIQAQVANNCSG